MVLLGKYSLDEFEMYEVQTLSAAHLHFSRVATNLTMNNAGLPEVSIVIMFVFSKKIE
jgi:hypothetical protein